MADALPGAHITKYHIVKPYKDGARMPSLDWHPQLGKWCMTEERPFL